MKRVSRTENEWFALGKAAFSSSTIGKLPPSDPALRDALRVLAVVRALHEDGYQRIRVSTGLSTSGMHWRCLLTTADNINPDGWSPNHYYDNAVHYSSADGVELFGWKDALDKNPKELAQLFVERFPDIAERGKGRDQAYADWFAGIMATAEAGRLPIFFADFDIDLSGVSAPPP